MSETRFSMAFAQYREVELSRGVIRYRDVGEGPPIVLVHGLLVNGRIWDRLMPLLSRRARCVVPELPLGSHSVPLGSVPTSHRRLSRRLIAELLERLELDDVTLVGNDTGGALSQLVAADHPERLGTLVLTNCDAFDHFPPPQLQPFVNGLALPGIAAGGGVLGHFRWARAADLDAEADRAPDRRRARAVVDGTAGRPADPRRPQAVPARHLRPPTWSRAAERLRGFDRPALLAWATRDPYFPIADAQRLAAVLPRGRLELIDDASTFVQLDAPERLAELILEHVDARGATAPAPQAAR